MESDYGTVPSNTESKIQESAMATGSRASDTESPAKRFRQTRVPCCQLNISTALCGGSSTLLTAMIGFP